MFIAGLGTAAPPERYSQAECWEALQRSNHWEGLLPRSRAILKKVLNGSSGIAHRHMALGNLQEAFELNPDAMHRRFKTTAPKLATEAAERALRQSGQRAADVDALIVSTCTGYLCPGLSSYAAERLGLRPEALLLDLVGQGCGAALPNLRTAQALLTSAGCGTVISICVEVCTAAFYLDNDPGVLVSACLFGDGAGAAVLTRKRGPGRSIRWHVSGSTHQPSARELLRFDHSQGMLRNILNIEVPVVAARHAVTVFHDVFRSAGLQPSCVTGWLFHPGGKDVLLALGREFRLHGDQLRWSAAVLNEYGNVSSASVFFVLQQALSEGAPGGHWWLSSFGAGFSCHGAILEVV
jgi:predicted naringenin-chalcone synthase